MKRPSLNHVYRLVWNERLNAWVAVAENVKARGKRASGALSLSVLMAMGLAPAAHADDAALPTGGQIVAGQGSINQQGNTLTLNQSSNRLIAQWDTFNIGKNSSVVFNQASASSVALNRILDSNPSEIFGSLSANGQVFLVNPNGIVFGRGSQVNVGGLVASSLNISNEDFLAGNLTFTGSDASGAIINQGSISAPGGVVALLAPQVTNEGTISANGGSALLAAGSGVSLDFVGDGLISYNIDAGTTHALVQNGGLVQADGGLAVLTAKAADAVNQAVVNNTGTVRAQTLAQREGRILLLSDMANGTTTNDGTLDASAPSSGDGGFIETSAANVKIGDNSVISTLAASGETGLWLLDPSNITIGAGGTITGAALATTLNTTNAVYDTAPGAGGDGDIFIEEAIVTQGGQISQPGGGHTLTLIANRDIHVNDAITANLYQLSVELRATRDVIFGAEGSVTTNGGNFTVGSSPVALGNYATATGRDLIMQDGSFVNVGNGSLDININRDIQLAANSLRASGSTTRYLNSGYNGDSRYSSYMRLVGVNIFSSNVDGAVADITGMTDVMLQSAATGNPSNPIKIRRTSLGNTLTVTNLVGNSYVNVLNADAQHGFSTVAVNIGGQGNSTQRLLLGGDLDDHGHILMNTDGSGVLNLLANHIDTSGTRSDIFISADDITFANNSVDVGNRSFTASAGTMVGDGTDGLAEVIGGSLSFNGTELGTLADRLEVAGGDISGGANSLSYNNGGGSTYITSVDDSFTSVNMTNVKNVGTHSVLFDTDHIDYTTDGTGILLPTITVSSGADVRARNRYISFTANTGDIRFQTDSVNTGYGSLAATINSGNPDGASGNAIHAVNGKDTQAEITTGNASFTVYTPGTGAISNIEIAKGVNASNNSLTVNTYGGHVDLTELDSHHFKSLSLTLNGAHAGGQTIDIDLNGSDDVSLADLPGRLTLDDTKLALTDFDRNWTLSATQRDVQIDSVDLGSGSYSISGSGLYLNGDVMTDGGAITLTSNGSNIHQLQSVRIDSNADDDSNTTSTGAAGSISVTGNISAANDGYTLAMDASSTTQAGGSLSFNGNLGNNAGSYLSGASFTTKGSTDNNDGSLTLYGTTFLLDGDFSAIGNTQLYGSNSVIFDTEQGNNGAGGNITFGGQSLGTSSSADYTFGTGTNAMGFDGGDVDLDTLTHSTLNARSIWLNTLGGSGQRGNIDLPGINTASSGYSGTSTNQSYTGNIITLHGNLTTNGGHVDLDGDTRLAENVTIKTSSATSNAGWVTFIGTGVSATAPGKNLIIDTSTNTSGAYNGGAVTLSTNNAGAADINDLTIEARALGSGGISGDVALTTGVETSGNQTYASDSFFSTPQGLTSPGTISITNASNATSTISGPITANSLALRGGSYIADNAANQVGTLAAQGGSLDFANNGAFTIGSVGGINGVTSSGTVDISTSNGDITLANNVSSSNTGAGAIVLNAGAGSSAGTATGGNILANNGVTVTTGAGGRATLYTGSVDNSTGLTDVVGFGSGNFRYNSDEGSSGFTKVLGAGVYAVYREQPTISVDVDDATAVYGSAPMLTTTFVNGKNGDAGANFTYSVGDGDSGTADGDVSTSGNYIVGAHSIIATSSSGAAELGYDVIGTTGGTLTVTAKELTVSGITADRTYDGTTDAVLDSSGALVGGLMGGDVVAQDYSGATGAFGDKNVGTGKTVTINGVTISGADAANYTVAASGTGDVSARVLNVGYTGVDRTYDGTSNASIVTSDDRIANDAFTIDQIASFGDKNVGVGKNVDISNISLSGADAGNYTLASNSDTTTADIAARTLNVDFTGTDRVYDGTTAATVTSSDDRIGGDDLSIDQSAALGDKKAGIGKTVNVSNVALSGADAGNYVLASNSGTATADIAARVLNVGFTGVDRTYDGTSNASVASSDDRIANDALAIDRVASFGDKNVGVGKTIDVTDVALSGDDAGNYVLASNGGTATADIAARVLNVGFTGVDRTYDGTSNASVASSDDRVANDALTIDRMASFGDKNVGVGKNIDISDVTLNGADAGNYVLALANVTATADVAARTLNIGFAGTNRVYDGTTATTVTSSDDRIAGDNLAIDQTATLADKNAGTGKIVNVSNVALSGADAGNYVLNSSTGTATADIAARVLTLGYTGDDKKFDGTPRAGVSIADDRAAGDALSFNVSARYTDFTIGDNREVLVDGVTLGGADAGNYVIANPTGSTTANIEPGPISNTILSSITSPQSSLNGTSSTSLTSPIIGAGAGSGSLIQGFSPVIADSRVAFFNEPFGLIGAGGTSGLRLSQFGATSTLAIGDAPAKPADRNTLSVYEARNSDVRFSRALDVVDNGNSLSVTAAPGTTSMTVDIVEATGPVATGSIVQPDGPAIDFQATVIPGSILLITLPANAPDIDVDNVALISLVLANKDLHVTPQQLKGLVIRKR